MLEQADQFNVHFNYTDKSIELKSKTSDEKRSVVQLKRSSKSNDKSEH